MKFKSIHKIVSICAVLFLVLPIGVQFSHALENHEHEICNAKDIQHIHKQELDCSFLHILVNHNSAFVFNNIFKIPSFYDETIVLSIVSGVITTTVNTKTSRGPPVFIV